MKRKGETSEQAGQGGVGFYSLLALLFIALKLLHQVEWSWWWVLSPLWIPSALFFVGFLIYLTVVLFKERSSTHHTKGAP